MILIIKKDETVLNDCLLTKSILLSLLKIFVQKNIHSRKFKIQNA